MPLLEIQKSLRELGRIRSGQKSAAGYPQKLTTWRITSPQRNLLDQAAELWGGAVEPWEHVTGQQWQVVLDADTLPIVIPGDESVTQWMEAWTAAGVARRCDQQREMLSDQPCICKAEDRDEQLCSPHTRLNVFLPEISDLGRFRLETQGWNAAKEIGGVADLLSMAKASFVPARLRLEHRSIKRPGEPAKDFVVPVIELDVQLGRVLDSMGVGGGAIGQIERPSAPRPALAHSAPVTADHPEDAAPFHPPASEPALAQSAPSDSTEPVEVDRRCPACGSEVWDNRQKIASGEFSEKSPKFSCRNKDGCTGTTPDGEVVTDGDAGKPWVTWHAHYFDASDLTPSEMATVEEISAHVETGAVSVSTVVAIARRVAKEYGEDGPTSVEGLASLSAQALGRVAEEVAIKVADSMGVAW